MSGERPTMVTDRLRLSPPESDDGPGVFTPIGDPGAVEQIPSDRIRDPFEADSLLRRWMQHREGARLYRLVPHAWGRGFATEAACAVIARAKRQLPDRKNIARVGLANLASRRVAIKAGLYHDPSLDDQRQDGLDLIFTA